MALSKQDSTINSRDTMMQRISARTLGGEHIIPQSLGGFESSSVIDDSDPNLTYGSLDGASTTFNYSVGDFSSAGTTVTQLTRVNAAVQYHFRGTKIGVLGDLSGDSGQITIYIDGVETPGSIASTGISIANTGPASPAIAKADTTINLYGGYYSFSPSGGRIRVGDELIDYSGTFLPGIGGVTPLRNTPGQLTGLTRGVGGTVAADHYRGETIYNWNSSIDLSTIGSDVSLRELIYYNDTLSPGEHRITVAITAPGSYSGGTNFWFDGFVVGSLVGASNLYTKIETLTKTVTTDSNGHADLGPVGLARADESLISMLPFSVAHATASTPSSSLPMGSIGMYFPTGGTTKAPYLYYHGGPASTSVTITLNFVIIGESV